MELIKKYKNYIIIALCALALISLFLPMATITAENEYADSSQSVTGFTIAFSRYYPILLILGPIALAISEYLPQLKPYKKRLTLAVPVVCIIITVISLLTASSVASAFDSEYADVSSSIGIGAILGIIAHLGIGILGFLDHKEEIMELTKKSK